MAGRFDKVAFAFNGTKVYDALFIKEKVPTYFVGCSATILKVIEKKNIPVDKFYFASYSVKTGYKECSADYKSRRLLINAEWVEGNVPGFGVVSPSHELQKEAKTYPPAPHLLDLEDYEKFTDDSGKVFNIEVRGERHVDKIWFKARDVEQMLLLDNIYPTVTDVKSSYMQGIHYQTFDRVPGNNSTTGYKNKNSNELGMYLSYWGLVKMLFGRRHPVAIKFQRWAIEKLFTLQHGTQDAKQELVADVLGVTPKALKAVLATNVTCMPAVYLFHLGTVKELRSTLNIPDSCEDNATVYKFGRSDNLQRRTTEHESNYGKLPGVSLRLKHHVYIDPLYTTEAEADIRRYFVNADWVLQHQQYNELAIVPQKLESMVREKFVMIGKTYAGKLEELQTQLASERRMVEELKHQMQVQEQLHKQILADKDIRLQREEARLAREAELYEQNLQIYQQNVEVHKEMQRKAEESQTKMEELYKALLKAQERELTLLRQ